MVPQILSATIPPTRKREKFNAKENDPDRPAARNGRRQFARGAVVTFSLSNTVAPLTNATAQRAGGAVPHALRLGPHHRHSGNEAVNSLGLNIAGRSANGGAVSATGYAIDNPGGTFAKRWSGTNLLGGLNTGGYLVNDARALTTAPTANSVINTPVVYATLTVTGVAPGTVNLFYSPSPLTISETNSSASVNNNQQFRLRRCPHLQHRGRHGECGSRRRHQPSPLPPSLRRWACWAWDWPAWDCHVDGRGLTRAARQFQPPSTRAGPRAFPHVAGQPVLSLT